MQSGVGHIENSSFPIGEKNTHAVLAGHTGLVRTKIFDDIDKLEIGDEFDIHILDEKYTYKVDQIKIVEPEDNKDVKIEEGKEYVTLLTCTPYGINSHRLLVRGSRVEKEEHNQEQEQHQEQQTIVNDVQQQEIKENKEEKGRNFLIIAVIVIVIIILICH